MSYIQGVPEFNGQIVEEGKVHKKQFWIASVGWKMESFGHKKEM